jgi:hypothetical protein
MSDRTQIRLRVDITHEDVIRIFNEVEQKIRDEVVKLLPYPDVKLTLSSFCLHKTVDDLYVAILKYKADVRYLDLRDTKSIDVVIRSDGIYAVL